jgi:hypothetical protein
LNGTVVNFTISRDPHRTEAKALSTAIIALSIIASAAAGILAGYGSMFLFRLLTGW